MMEMIQIGDKIAALSLLDQMFVCDIEKCKGACCVQGDAGAPLLVEETDILTEIFEKVKSYMRPEAIDSVNQQGCFVVDEDDGELVTPLLNGKECVYSIFENGIAKCSIEKAWHDGKIDFRKPVSCHLYPIRVKEHKTFTAVNYDKWPICAPAIVNGEKLGVPVYSFCKESIIRRFGDTFYDELEIAAQTFAADSH